MTPTKFRWFGKLASQVNDPVQVFISQPAPSIDMRGFIIGIAVREDMLRHGGQPSHHSGNRQRSLDERIDRLGD